MPLASTIRPIPRTSETKNAYSCETPRRRGLTLAICSAAAALASAIVSAAASRASATRSDGGVAGVRHPLGGVVAGLVEALTWGHRSQKRQSGAGRRDAGAGRDSLRRTDAISSVYRRGRRTLPASRIVLDGMSAAASGRPACSGEPHAPRQAPPRRRRRECSACGHRFTTFERREAEPTYVRKRDGRAPALRPGEAPRRAAALHPQAPGECRLTSRRWSTRVALAIETAGGELAAERIGELCLEGLAELDRGAYLQFLGTLPADIESRSLRSRLRTGSVRGRSRECIVTGSNGLRGGGKSWRRGAEDVGKRCKHR